MRKLRKGISGLLAFVMALSAMVCNMAVTASAATPTLWVVGDSTACHYGENDDTTYYYRRVGYGDQLESYFDKNKIHVENLALGGRSSKSFVNDSNGGYDKMKSQIQSGDILLLAFGHNDEKSDDANRYTTPTQDINDSASFAYSLKTNYIDIAKAKGATAVVCSPIVRLPSNLTSFKDSDIHKTNGGDYAAAAKYAAEQTGAEFIDLTKLTSDIYSNNFKAAAKYHAWTADATKPENKYSAENLNINRIDTTHINNYGAKMIAHLIATNLPEGSKLNQYLIPDAAAPTENDLNYNDNYVEPDNSDKTGDELVNAWEVTAPWHTTFFGASSGKNKYTVTEENGAVNMKTTSGADGKLTAGNAGIAMYYRDFAAGGPIEIHALAHINKYSYVNQTGFGALINDNIVINNNAEEAYDKVVFASPFIGKYSSFSKNDTAFEYGLELSTLDLKDVDEVNVDIVKLGNQFAVNFGGATKVYTLEGMSDRAYAGLFVSRDADITFKNVYAGNEVVEGTDINNLIKHENFNAVLNCKNSVDGNDVSNITVSDAEGSPVSAEEGKYTLMDGQVYTVSAPGYVDKKVLAISRYATRDIVMTPSAQITLNVTPADVSYTVKDNKGNVVTASEGNVYPLVPGVEYTVSAEGYKDYKFTASADELTVNIQLEKVDLSNVQSFDYWFDQQNAENLKKNTYYLDGGEVTLYADFSAQRGYTDGTHTSYQGTSSQSGKALDSAGGTIQAGKQIKPADGNAYSFKPYADGTVKFYGANNDATKSFDILTVDADGNPVGNAESITNTDAKVPQEYDVKANYTYYVFGNSGSGASAFLGFEYTVAKNVTINGKIARTNNDGLADDLHTITFTPKTGEAVTADIENDAFTVTLIAGKEYSVKTDSSLLMITDPQTITVTEEMGTSGLTVNMTKAQDEKVTGQVYGLDKYDGVTITFTKDSDVKTVNTFDSDGKYTVELQPGTWKVNVTDIAGYTLSDLSKNDLVVKQSSDPTAENWKNVLFKSAPKAATANKVYVDGADKGENHYDTIRDAIAGLKSGSQTKGSTVVLTSGQTYTEQVVVDVENVRFETSSTEPAEISWYYGIGYTYYSAGPDGFYNEDYAVDRHSRKGVSKWGTAVRVTKSGFEAENITFTNTFNIKVTPEEKADGVKADTTAYTDTKITLDRTTDGFDPQTRAATERAAAIVLDSGNAAFEKCQFYSSQDTIYSVGNIYFKNCTISGGIDYMFNNSGNVIVDNSKLEWKGYSANPAGGYITAARGKYIFRNCEVTQTELQQVKGFFGRPWGATADVTFINTKTNGLIDDAGWKDMSGVTPDQVKMFGSYNSTTTGDVEFKTKEGTNLTEDQLGNMLDPAYDMEYFTPEWLPFNHDAYADVAGAVVTWDFAAGNTSLSSGAIQNKTGKVTTENSKLGTVALDVDATNNGKLADASGKAQFNAGTIIKVPVYLAGDVITVAANSGYHYYTVAGTPVEEDTYTYTVTQADVDKGYVEIVATSQAYLSSIKLETLYEPVAMNTYEFDFVVSDLTQNDPMPATLMSKDGKGILEIANFKRHQDRYGACSGTNGTLTFTMAEDADTTEIILSTSYEENKGNAVVYVNDTKTIDALDITTTDNTNQATAKATLNDLKAGDVVKISLEGATATFYSKGLTVKSTGTITSEIEEPVTPTTVTWNFQNNNTDLVANEAHQNGEQFMIAVTETPEWKLDVTATGKVSLRSSGDLQVNEGAVIKVPVRAKGDKITVVANGNNYGYTIGSDSKAADNITFVYTVTDADVESGYAAITATKYNTDKTASYFYSITLETTGTAPEEEKLNDYNFGFTSDVTGDDKLIQNEVVDIPANSEGIEGTLTVDTADKTFGTSPKLQYNSDTYGCEVGDGTQFKFTLAGEGTLNTEVKLSNTYTGGSNESVEVCIYEVTDGLSADSEPIKTDTVSLKDTNLHTISFQGEAGKQYVVVVKGSGLYTKGIDISTAGQVEEKEPAKPTTDITWTFDPDNNKQLSRVQVQGKKAGYVSDQILSEGAPSAVLYVDATNGKFAPQNNEGQANNWTQINSNTIIKVPVYAVGDTIAITCHSIDDNKYTVGSETITGTYTAKETDVEAGYVELTRLNDNGYIGKITLTTTGDIPGSVFEIAQVKAQDTETGKDVYIIAKLTEDALNTVDSIGIGVGKSSPGALAESNNAISEEEKTSVFEQIVIDEENIVSNSAYEGYYLAAVKVAGYGTTKGTLYAAPYVMTNGKAVYGAVEDVSDVINE